MATTDPDFNPSDSKYKCCCGCHVTTGTYIICMITAVYLSIVLFASIYFAIFTNLIWIFPLALVGLLIALGPIIGIKKTIPWLFIPFLMLYATEIIYKVIRSVDALIQAGARHSTPRFISILAFAILQVAISVWFFSIIFRCGKYVYEMKKVKESQNVLPLTHHIEATAPKLHEEEEKLEVAGPPPPYS